jgi:murein DD-endopeptidase MepM/ murein hydrolase activator NlpD
VKTRVLFGAFLLASFCGAAGAGESGRIKWPRSIEVAQGEITEVKISGADLAAVEGRWGEEKIYFNAESSGSFSALLGADVEAKPIRSKLIVRVTRRSGQELQSELPVKVKVKSFQTQSFNVPASFDQMTPETLQEIEREREAFKRAFAAPIAAQLWDAPFIRPVPQEASPGSFGARRVINGTPRAPHSGTDLAAPAGVEVLATNHGRVVLVGNFFFAGGSIVLDHGGGLFTMYFHLSDFKVDDGAMVKKGDVIGLSGATGRVTGAHLHWGARLANARVEPFELINKIAKLGKQGSAAKTAEKREQ